VIYVTNGTVFLESANDAGETVTARPLRGVA